MNRKDEIAGLRHEGYLQQEVADILNVSKAYVSHVLIKRGMGGKLQYPELEDSETFKRESDSAIAKRLRVPLSRVETARRKLGIYRFKAIRLDRRRKFLANDVFGAEPGPNFVEYMVEFIEKYVPEKQAELLTAYITGKKLENSQYERSYRSYARKTLKEIVKEMHRQEFVEAGVING